MQNNKSADSDESALFMCVLMENDGGGVGVFLVIGGAEGVGLAIDLEGGVQLCGKGFDGYKEALDILLAK